MLAMKITLPTLIALTLIAIFLGTTSTGSAKRRPQDRPADDIAFEEAQTAKLLGVPLQKFPAPQGLDGMDEIPATARPFTFTLKSQPPSGPPPRVYFEERKLVKAVAPDGSIYEAYCGHDHDEPQQIAPGHRFVSTFENRRQWYGTHHGYGYMPQDVYIGKREGGRIKPTLFFRDIGSHTTAPHALAIDNRGMVHLAVADVNISQGNRLDVYWVIGDPKVGRWTAAGLIDRRGFTSWSHPWSAAWSDKVHLLWDWCDVSINKRAPGMGAYHVERSANGFRRKTRIFAGPVRELDAAIDQRSGLLVIVLVKDSGGVYVLSRTAEGKWTRPTLLHSSLTGDPDVSIVAADNGAFVIRANSDIMRERPDRTKEWLLRPVQ
jgi:hypothetical protein